MSKLNHYIILLIFSLLILVPGITNVPVIDRDEAHFAQATKQMIQNDNYFQIRFQEITRFQKPPGINWLQAASLKLFSQVDAHEIWPYRLPSLLGALFSIVLTYFFARRFFDPKTAFFGAGLLATTLLLVFESHMAVIDSMLLFSVVLMQGSLWIVYEKEDCHWGWALCFWLSLAFGLVLKGVTPLVAVLTLFTLCVVDRNIQFIKRLHPVKGLILFSALTLIWVLGVNAAEHSNYLMQMIHKDLLPKLQGGHESHGKPPLFHLAILPLTFWPASLFLWQVAVYGFLKRKQKNIRFLLAWILPTWIFFELMPTKLPQYVLPTFPALAVLMALSFEQMKVKPAHWVHVLQILWILLTLGIGVAIASVPYLLMQQITWDSMMLIAVITVMSIWSVLYAWQGKSHKAATVLFVMSVLVYPLVFGRILPQLKPLWLTSNLVKKLDMKQVSEEKPILVIDFGEPSLAFNLNTKLVAFTSYKNAEHQLKSDPSRIIVVPESFFKAMPESEQLKYRIQSETRGFNYSKGKWVTLLVITAT